MVNAILRVLRSGAPWRDLPERYPSWKMRSSRCIVLRASTPTPLIRIAAKLKRGNAHIP
jgi:transposase